MPHAGRLRVSGGARIPVDSGQQVLFSGRNEGIHLLDEKTDTYNAPFCGDGVGLVPGYVRRQGVVTRDGTADGRLALSYPARRDRAGNQHHVIRPVDDGARRDLECQIFAKLGIEQEVES